MKSSIENTLKRIDTKHVVMGFILILLTFISIIPLIFLLKQSLLSPELTFTLNNYSQTLMKSQNLKAFMNTIYMCTGTVIVSVLIGLPLGFILTRTNVPFRQTFQNLFKLPYLLPPILGAISWIHLMNPNVGILNNLLEPLFGEKIFNIYSIGGLVWILSLFFYSFIYISVMTSLEKMDVSLEEAASMCGANRWQVIKDITIPLIRPALISGMILVFVAAAASFGVPAIIGMPFRLYVLTTKIYSYTQSFSGGMGLATALSVLLLFVAGLFLLINRTLIKSSRYTIITGKSSRPGLNDLGPFKIPLFCALCVLLFIILIMPMGTILMTSLLENYGGNISFENLTWAHYKNVLLKNSNVPLAIKNSLYLAAISSTLAVFIGLIVSYISKRTQMKGKFILDLFCQLPYATPGVVLAIGLILTFTGQLKINLYNTLSILIVAYLIKYLAFAVQTISGSLDQVHPSLEESAATSGASWVTMMKTILLPILKPALIGSWFLIFMPTFSEITMSVMLFGPETPTIGTELFHLQNYEDPQAASVLAVIIFILIIALNSLVKLLTRGRFGI